MSNKIVFQNSASQLKVAIFGYDGTDYKQVSVNADGAVKVDLTGTLSTIGTVNRLMSGTLSNVATISKVIRVGTVNRLVSGTLSNVATISKVITVGTINRLVSGTLSAITGTIKTKLIDRTFTSDYKTVDVTASTSTYSTLLDVSKYEDTAWYIRNLTGTGTINVTLCATPSLRVDGKVTSTYPRVLIAESAEMIGDEAKVITNDYYMKYIGVYVTTSTVATQKVSIAFNGRY